MLHLAFTPATEAMPPLSFPLDILQPEETGAQQLRLFPVLCQIAQLFTNRLRQNPKRILSKSAGSAHRWHGDTGPVGDALGEAGGGPRVCAPGVGAPVPCGQVLLEIGCGPVRVTGQDICRAKCPFALFGVPSGRMAGGQGVCRAKGHFALFAVPSIQAEWLEDGMFVGRRDTSPSLGCPPYRRGVLPCRL